MRAAWLCALLACAGVAGAGDGKQEAPSLDAFDDAIHHWRNVHGDKYPRHASDAVAKIAENRSAAMNSPFQSTGRSLNVSDSIISGRKPNSRRTSSSVSISLSKAASATEEILV